MHAPFTHMHTFTEGMGAGGVVRQLSLKPVQAELPHLFFVCFKYANGKWKRLLADKSNEAVKSNGEWGVIWEHLNKAVH